MRVTAISFFLAASLAAVGLPATASTVIISPVAATATNELAPAVGIGNTIDQSGLSVGFVSGVTDFDAYFALNPLHDFEVGTEWFTADGVTAATVIYDLGAIFDVVRFALWNEDAVGFGSADVAYSTDGTIYTSLGSLSGTNHPLSAFYPADIFNLSFTGRFFSMELSGCPLPGGPGNQSCAIGEVAFGVSTGGDVGVIPVPASQPLLAGGLGLLAALGRRRRGRAA
jgi:hypothetical protein